MKHHHHKTSQMVIKRNVLIYYINLFNTNVSKLHGLQISLAGDTYLVCNMDRKPRKTFELRGKTEEETSRKPNWPAEATRRHLG